MRRLRIPSSGAALALAALAACQAYDHARYRALTTDDAAAPLDGDAANDAAGDAAHDAAGDARDVVDVTTCVAPRMLCGVICTDLQTDTANCGVCGRACPAPTDGGASAVATCVAGACGIACTPGFTDCDHDVSNGCEVATANDVHNCGACDHACPVPQNTTATCAGGVCGAACVAGFADCDGTTADGCEMACAAPANASPTCSGAPPACGFACDVGFADCDLAASNGCEIDTANDLNNCGTCTHACALPNATAVCRAGACQVGTCTGAFRDCDFAASNGCETNVQTSNTNCGACGVVCHGMQVCLSGVCSH
jgi:hypothetical protein